MNGIHDMGGLHGFGEVVVEQNEPVFHSRWEGRVFALTQIMDLTGLYSLDEHRHEIELMQTPDYLRDGYYGRWLFALESILLRKHVLHECEIENRIQNIARDNETYPAVELVRNWPLREESKIRWGAWRHEEKISPRFAVGDIVRIKNWQPPGHTRLPAYLRSKVGTIEIVNNQAWIFPDTRAHEKGENLQAVYNVSFEAGEVWGEFAEPNSTINVDLSEFYLEKAETYHE